MGFNRMYRRLLIHITETHYKITIYPPYGGGSYHPALQMQALTVPLPASEAAFEEQSKQVDIAIAPVKVE